MQWLILRSKKELCLTFISQKMNGALVLSSRKTNNAQILVSEKNEYFDRCNFIPISIFAQKN